MLTVLGTLPDLNNFSPLKTFKERDSDQRCRLGAGMGQLMDRVPLRKTRGFGTQPTNLVEKTTKTMPGMLERRVRRSRLTSLLPHNRGDAIRDFCCCQVWSLEEMPASCISDHPVAVEGPIFPQLQPENTKYQKMQSKEKHSVLLLFCNFFAFHNLSLRFPRLHHNKPRLTHYLEESNQGRGFIKEICFSGDGRVIGSPYGM